MFPSHDLGYAVGDLLTSGIDALASLGGKETNLTEDEIEEGVWVGGLEIALLHDGTSVTADADIIQIEEE